MAGGGGGGSGEESFGVGDLGAIGAGAGTKLEEFGVVARFVLVLSGEFGGVAGAVEAIEAIGRLL